MKVSKQSILTGAVMAFALVGAPAVMAVQPAGVSGLVGTWVNVNPATGGAVKIIITNDAAGFRIHTYGACSPTPCDHGAIPALRFSNSVGSSTADGFSGQYNFGFSTVLVTGQRNYEFDGITALELDTRTRFAAGDTRRDYMRTELFRKQ